jgi:acetyl-CoA acetyltransferase
VTHPWREVAIVGAYNTAQARHLPDHDSATIALDGALGALEDAGLARGDVDASVGEFAEQVVLRLGLGTCTRRPSRLGIPALLDAAGLVAHGEATVVVIAAGGAGLYADRRQTAPWTRPPHELTVGYGLFTAAEFALMARRHMIRYGTTPEQLATVAATIRNHGHVNPEAVYRDRGPFSTEDILSSRMVAEPFHLLECAMTSEGGCGLVLAAAERVADCRRPPVWILGGAGDCLAPAYTMAPVWDWDGQGGDGIPAGYVGRRAARHALRTAGLGVEDVDVAELYDPFSFEIIRQLEAYGFCGEGEGGAYVEEGHIAVGGRLPVATDGGTLSFSHPGINAQQLQRVVRAVQQLRGECASGQVAGAEVALCSNGGSGALFTDVVLLGSERP